MKRFSTSGPSNRSDVGLRARKPGRRPCSFADLGAAIALVVLVGFPASAAEWHFGFEAAEGFGGGTSPIGEHVTIIGGDVAVLSGGAAEGEQFLRYVPGSAENALVVKMGDDVSVPADRSVQFAVRLSGEGQTARLVLSGGQTIGLQPVEGGALIDVMGGRTQLVPLDKENGGWVSIGLHQSASGGTWDMTVGGQLVAVDVPSLDEAEVLRDLLIFADGALDVDAIHVTTPEADSNDVVGGDGKSGGTESGGTGVEDVGTTADRTDPTGMMRTGTKDEEILEALSRAAELRAMAEVKRQSDGTIPDGALLFPAKDRVLAGDPAGAWKWLTLDREAYTEAPAAWAEVLGRRAAVVVGFLNNQSRGAEAESFASFALETGEMRVDALSGSKTKGQALYWRARLANEVFGRRDDALRWAVEADGNDPDSDHIGKLKTELTAAAAAFPER